MLIGREQIYNPSYSSLEKIYIGLFGMPIIGLRVRARNVFSLIPRNRYYRHILDAGSGPGVFSFELARRYPHAQVVGMDILEEEIGKCRHIAEKMHIGNVRFYRGDIAHLRLPFSFDLIICVDILEHIEYDGAALSELYEGLSYGGILVLHVPALYRRFPVWRKQINFDVESHVRPGYEPEEIRRKVERSGFRILKSGFTYGFWETLANNISYLITRARLENRIPYAVAFPFLYLISFFGYRSRPKSLGAGIYLVAQKDRESRVVRSARCIAG